MLYVIASPFGNFQDVTFRAKRVLQGCDCVLTDNVAQARKLLDTLGIDIPCMRYYKYNEYEKQEEVLALIKEGRDLALFDTGETQLVLACKEANLSYTHLPTVDPFTAALTLSGMQGERVQFLGQLPKKSKEQIALLGEVLTFPGATFFIEQPARLVRTLEIIRSLEGERSMKLFRYLSTEREEVVNDSADSLCAYCEKTPIDEPCVVMIAQGAMTNSYDHLTLQNHVLQLEKELGYSRKEAIKAVAELRDLPKRTVHHSVQEQDHDS